MKHWTDNTPNTQDNLDVIPVVPNRDTAEQPAPELNPAWKKPEGYELIPVLILSVVLLFVVGGGLLT